MTCPDTRIQPEEPPPPADHFTRVCKVCIDCAYCSDGGAPHKPEQWVCRRDVSELLCHVSRNMPHHCGIGGKWFRSALAGR